MEKGELQMGKSALRSAVWLLVLALLLTAGAEERFLIPGGQLVGVTARTDGLVYVGASDLGTEASPARMAGLKSGDVITKINGIQIDGIGMFTKNLRAERENALEVIRDGENVRINLTAKTDPRDGKTKIGAWVRESVAGLGTLTYIDPKTGEFAALGHEIRDPDAGITVPVKEGTLYDAAFTGIVKGESGAPGELMGTFLEDGEEIGKIDKNSSSGISGTFTKADLNGYLYSGPVAVADIDEVKTGHAEIISTISETGPDVYGIDIISIDKAGSERNFLIKVTDQALLNKTGGIVQGMSGSPIIQNGKIIGAVTHVLVNSPDTGYGIFIRNMLEAAG